MYLLFIDGLIKDLEASGYGICVFNTNLGTPTVADDMVLVSFSKYGLEQMLIICHKYFLKWRYEYNASKCSVIVFNELQSAYKKSKRQWELHSQQTINESENYTHLDVNCNKYMCIADSVREASTKLRGTFLSLVNSGLHPHGLNPLTF